MKNLSQMMFLLLVVTVISSACEEYELFKPSGQPVDSVKVDSTALLTWTGEYETDGCGFFITVDGTEYKPENERFIDDSFKDVYAPFGTEVVVEYRILDRETESYCESMPETRGLPAIKIISIRRSQQVITSEAILTWTGEYEVDGCGFLITIDSLTYKPHNEEIIGDNFKVSGAPGIKVLIDYKPLDIEIAYYCGDAPEPKVLAPIQVFSLKRE